MLELSEIFYSLQGESTYAGHPCCFIRLSGCNLRCGYCDARYTYEEPGELVDVADIIASLARYRCLLAEITGGEPLLQDDVHDLSRALLDRGYTVLLETNGSLSLEPVDPRVRIVMDIKCPESGMQEALHPDNISILEHRRRLHSGQDEVKFVISSPHDYRWARHLVGQYDLHRFTTVLFSPVTAAISPTMLAELILGDNLPVRLQIQLHTLLWPGETRGK